MGPRRSGARGRLDLRAASASDRTSNPPAGYFINCVHPRVLETAREEGSLLERLIGFQANTSARSPAELARLEDLETEAPDRFAVAMLAVQRRLGLRVLGGCCGTDTRHIDAIARAHRSSSTG